MTRPRRRVLVVRRAEGEITEAARWWRQNRLDAPEAIRDELARAFDLISVHPEAGAKALNPVLPGIRRVHLARIRYHLYYRVTPSAIEVLAFWHSSRGSNPSL